MKSLHEIGVSLGLCVEFSTPSHRVLVRVAGQLLHNVSVDEGVVSLRNRLWRGARVRHSEEGDGLYVEFDGHVLVDGLAIVLDCEVAAAPRATRNLYVDLCTPMTNTTHVTFDSSRLQYRVYRQIRVSSSRHRESVQYGKDSVSYCRNHAAFGNSTARISRASS